MIFNHIKIMIIFMLFTLVSSASFASGEAHKKPAAHAAKKTTKHIIAGPTCVGFGPQTPRDIDGLQGTNPQQFSLAPKSKGMNLCNIHFHNNAEHKARAFSIYAGEGDHGHGGGYQCNISKSLSQAELKVPATKICKGLKPGAGLGSCLSKKCANPDLRVETQVFALVNDPSAVNYY